jgi:hypothetical protein
MKKLNELFDVTYGSKFDLNKMTPLSPSEGGVNFVARSSENQGVVATVAVVAGVDPFPAGTITVALGGSKLLSSFVQQGPFYTAQNVAVLKPKLKLTLAERIFVCVCIRHNRFRYSAFGREANRTLRELPIPDSGEFPKWIKSADFSDVEGEVTGRPPQELKTSAWKKFRLDNLFDIRKGKRITKADSRPGNTPFISATMKNNGIARFVSRPPNHEGNTLSVTYDGSIGEAFYQPTGYWASDDINVMCPRFKMTPAIGLFLATVIRHERYRYTFGRKWNLDRMKPSTIRLPVKATGEPDWNFMERYIGSLPYGSKVEAGEGGRTPSVARQGMR